MHGSHIGPIWPKGNKSKDYATGGGRQQTDVFDVVRQNLSRPFSFSLPLYCASPASTRRTCCCFSKRVQTNQDMYIFVFYSLHGCGLLRGLPVIDGLRISLSYDLCMSSSRFKETLRVKCLYLHSVSAARRV